ncbi:MAG: phosphomannomutase/phosphoglucomutase, partial [Candidatus Saccharibacteria bacterium]|nr:phosphomannomutase/phosphoglucomutase [Candidatus Saccharibacteria bacterium]
MSVTIAPTLFKSYDARGKVGTELTSETTRVIGQAFADWLPTEGAVAVGRDMRPDSEELANGIIQGLVAQGRDVWDIGEVTSDMIYFAVGSNKLAGGVMVTASHNPGEYNGIKFCAEEAKAVGENSGLFEVRDLAIKQQFKTSEHAGTVTQHDLAEAWIDHVLNFIEPDKLKPLKLAVDAGNGMAGKIFPELEPHVPWEITEMYFELDGTFPNHEANPLKFETLHDLIEMIKSKKLDGGIAFDGDGDRAFLIDETGEVLTGGVMSAMLSEYFLKLRPGSNIVYDIRNSAVVAQVIAENGGTPVRERVGHSHLKQKMREVDAPFGGEASGHFYFKDNWYADSGMIGAVIGLYAAGTMNMSLSQIGQPYPRMAAIPETNFTVGDKDAVIKK